MWYIQTPDTTRRFFTLKKSVKFFLLGARSKKADLPRIHYLWVRIFPQNPQTVLLFDIIPHPHLYFAGELFIFLLFCRTLFFLGCTGKSNPFISPPFVGSLSVVNILLFQEDHHGLPIFFWVSRDCFGFFLTNSSFFWYFFSRGRTLLWRIREIIFKKMSETQTFSLKKIDYIFLSPI